MNPNIPLGGKVSMGFIPPASTPITEEETVNSSSSGGSATEGASAMGHVSTDSLAGGLLLDHVEDPGLAGAHSSELADHTIIHVVTASNSRTRRELDEVPATLGHAPRTTNQLQPGTLEFNEQLEEALHNATLPQAVAVGGALGSNGPDPSPAGTRVRSTTNIDIPPLDPETMLNNIVILGAEGSAQHFLGVVNAAIQRAATEAAQDLHPDLFHNRGVERWIMNAPPLLAHAGSLLSLIEQGQLPYNDATTMLNTLSHALVLMAQTTRQVIGGVIASVTVINSAAGDANAAGGLHASAVQDHEYSILGEIDRLATLVENLNHANQAHALAGHANQAVLIDAGRQLLSAIGQAVYSVRAARNMD